MATATVSKGSSKTRTTQAKRKPAQPSRDRPMFFKGQQQSKEFARGAWAARDLTARLQALEESHDTTIGEITAELADEFNDHVTRGGEYARGFVTAIVEFLAFHESAGVPNLEVWQPLRMEPRYTSHGVHPTPGSKLFDYGGVPVSIAPDETVNSWADAEDTLERAPDFLQAVLKHGTPISLRTFNAMRAKAKAALKKGARNHG